MGTSQLSGKPDEMLGVTCDELASHPGGVATFVVLSCYGNPPYFCLSVCLLLFFLFLQEASH